jgi:hypothetical protein
MTANTIDPAVSRVNQTTPWTFAEITDIRRYCGYPAYAAFGYMFEGVGNANLDSQLANMSDQEQAVIRTKFLPNLATLESNVMLSQTNVGTDEAAVWKRNPRELQDRVAAYRYMRRELCHHCGVHPGPGLGKGGGSVVRC